VYSVQKQKDNQLRIVFMGGASNPRKAQDSTYVRDRPATPISPDILTFRYCSALTYRKYKHRFHISHRNVSGADVPLGTSIFGGAQHEMVSNQLNFGWANLVPGMPGANCLDGYAESCWDQAASTGARRPAQCIGRPRLSWRGSVPNVFRRSHLQPSRGGCGRRCWFSSTKTPAHS
jgi:hypothetical protein